MILIIDNYDSFTYNLYQLIAKIYQDVRVVRNDKITLNEVRELSPSAIILSPGPGRPESAGICIPLICALLQREMHSALLGVCLGHQAIAVALGGDVLQAKEIAHGKADWIYHDKAGLYQDLPQPFKVGRYHSLIIDRDSLPASLDIAAQNADKLIMGIRHRELPIHGMQFHPESILTPQGEILLQAFMNSLPKRAMFL